MKQFDMESMMDGDIKKKLGSFPGDWEISTFGSLFEFYGGLGKSRDELTENGIEYLHYGDIHCGGFNIIEYEKYVNLPKYSIQVDGEEKFLMGDGDVAFVDASEDVEGTSRLVLIDNPCNKPFLAGLHIILGKSKSNKLTKWYKQYITKPQYVRRQFAALASGFKVYGINRNTLGKIQIAYPRDIKEQEKIAEILMKWDEVIYKQEKYVDKLKTYRYALLQRCFAKENVVKTRKLKEDICQHTKRNNTGIKNVLSVSNQKGFIKQEEQFSKKVAGEDLTNYKIINKDNIAYNPSRINVGSIALYTESEIGIVSPMYIVFSCKKIQPKYLLLFLETCKGKYEIEKYLSGSVRESLSFNDLCNIEFPVIKDGIENIVKLFNTVDENFRKEELLLIKYKQQRKALQHLLLNGIVRVK